VTAVSDAAALVFGIVALLVVANAVAFATFRFWPSLLVSENEKLQMDYLARFSGALRPYIAEWFEIADGEWDAFCAEYRQGAPGINVYADFVGFTHPQRVGKYLNISEAGFRCGAVQGPWPLSTDFYNVFFFGGSTTLHPGPDWTTIPNYLQERLNTRQAAAKPVRVYNFGRGAWFSTQERILLQQLLLEGAVPDMAIFLDGVNDFYFFEGQTATAGFFRHALDEHNRENHELLRNKLAARPKWRKLLEFAESLPLARAITAAARAAARRGADPGVALYRPTPVADERLLATMRRFLGNTRQIEAIAREYDIVPVFVVQPTPAYKYDLQHHMALNAHYGLGGHERSGQGYRLLADFFASHGMPPTFVWLADMQEQARRPLYLDNMHYTADMNRMIADRLADALADRVPQRQREQQA
jgi:hypothetical protein